MCAGSLLGFPLGIFAVQHLDVNMLKISVAALILLTTVHMIFYNGEPKEKAVKNQKIHGTNYIIGLISGALMSGLSTPGPVIMLYLSKLRLNKDEVRATILGFYALAYAGAALTQYIMVGFSSQLYDLIWSMIPFIILGVVIGHLVAKHIKQNMFRMIVLTVLIVSSVYTIWVTV